MNAAVVVFTVGFVLGFAPSVIDRAIRNRDRRRARAALAAGSVWLDALVQDALEGEGRRCDDTPES